MVKSIVPFHACSLSISNLSLFYMQMLQFWAQYKICDVDNLLRAGRNPQFRGYQKCKTSLRADQRDARRRYLLALCLPGPQVAD